MVESDEVPKLRHLEDFKKFKKVVSKKSEESWKQKRVGGNGKRVVAKLLKKIN